MQQTAPGEHHDRSTLENIARRVMQEKALLPDFSAAALAELARLQSPAVPARKGAGDLPEYRDLTGLLWASIDNDDSRDLDQVTVAESPPGKKTVVRVAIADVDSLVRRGTALDEHARRNTSSVYTAGGIFPMLPEKLSTDLTSLGFDAERPALVVEMEVGADGSLLRSDIYRARVRNHAKLAYDSVAAWLEGSAAPMEIAAVNGLAENLRAQDRIAQAMKALRHEHGALSLESNEAKPVFDGDQIHNLEVEQKNRAKEIIEDFMIAANGVTARYLASKGFPSIRRVVRTPKRWGRLVEVAKEHGFTLPAAPDSAALEAFLVKEKAADPLRFPDLSLVVIKLLGAGEYVAERPGSAAPGHFGLAVRDYAHSTAPNRRYADLVAQRLLKAAIDGKPSPYDFAELDVLARHLTEAEDAINKVERQVGKSAAALLLQSRIGEQFDGIITGASEKGTWARLLSVPVEGRVARGFDGLDVGQQVRLRLMSVDVERGYIDFEKIGAPRQK